MNGMIGRANVEIVQNKSGGTLVQGDVVVRSGSTASGVTTTTTLAYATGQVGVVFDAQILNDGYGLVAFGGYVPKINLSSSASLLDLVKTHTVAKQGAPHASPYVSGDFAQVLGTGTSPAANLFGAPIQAATSGLVLISETILSAGDGTFTFSAIPATYRALKIYAYVRSDVAATSDTLDFQVGNGSLDTGANYNYLFHGEGSAASNVTGTAQTRARAAIIPGNTATASMFGTVEITIPMYAVSTLYRNMIMVGGNPDLANAYRICNGIAVWKNTTQALDIIKLLPNGGTNFKQYSRASLYGEA